MHAVIAGRGRRTPGNSGSRFIYTSANGEACNWWRFFSVASFSLAGIGALSGIMLTVFGSTGFFRTNRTNEADFNEALVIVGVVLLVSAILFLVSGFVFSRKVPPQIVIQHSPRFNNPSTEE